MMTTMAHQTIASTLNRVKPWTRQADNLLKTNTSVNTSVKFIHLVRSFNIFSITELIQGSHQPLVTIWAGQQNHEVLMLVQNWLRRRLLLTGRFLCTLMTYFNK